MNPPFSRPRDVVESILKRAPDSTMTSLGYTRKKWSYIRTIEEGVVHYVNVDISPRSTENNVRFSLIPEVCLKRLGTENVIDDKYPICLSPKFNDYCTWKTSLYANSDTVDDIAKQVSTYLMTHPHPCENVVCVADFLSATKDTHPASLRIHVRILLAEGKRQEAIRHYESVLGSLSFPEWIAEVQSIGKSFGLT